MTSLNVLQNYFDNSNKIIFIFIQVKISVILAKPFFPWNKIKIIYRNTCP